VVVELVVVVVVVIIVVVVVVVVVVVIIVVVVVVVVVVVYALNHMKLEIEFFKFSVEIVGNDFIRNNVTGKQRLSVHCALFNMDYVRTKRRRLRKVAK
jgi:hypothetical protein